MIHFNNSTLSGNIISENSRSGIKLFGIYNCTITKNIVFNNYFNGISIGDRSQNNNISENIVFNNRLDGISFFNFFNTNQVNNNNIYFNGNGIHIDSCPNTYINTNFIFDCEIGIYIKGYSSGTNITNNSIQNNSIYGVKLGSDISLKPVSSCIVSWNSFYNNSYSDENLSQAYEQIRDDGSDSQNIFTFNYWNEWIIPDINQDGIVDDPYLIDGSNTSDLYPLVAEKQDILIHFLSESDILIPDITENFESIFIYWRPVIDSLKYSIRYSLYYSNDLGISWNQLIYGTSDIIYIWNATLLDAGCYQLKVVALSTGGLSTESLTEYFPLKMDHRLSSPQFISPINEKILSNIVTIQWSPAIDNCYNSVTYNLSYSVDGYTWILLASGINGTSFEWDTASIDNCNYCRIKITAISSSGLISSSVAGYIYEIKNSNSMSFFYNFPVIYLSPSLIFIVYFKKQQKR